MTTIQTMLATAAGYRSNAVGRFMWQLDEQRRVLLEDLQNLDAEALEWQPHPGMNTIGMLLAHLAYAESHLVQVGLQGKATSDTRAVIGIGVEEEGVPLAPDAPPSPALASKDLDYFMVMLERARAETRRVAASLADSDLGREIVRERPGAPRRVFNVAWVFYHMIEHEARHRGQIALLKHLRTAMGGR